MRNSLLQIVCRVVKGRVQEIRKFNGNANCYGKLFTRLNRIASYNRLVLMNCQENVCKLLGLKRSDFVNYLRVLRD